MKNLVLLISIFVLPLMWYSCGGNRDGQATDMADTAHQHLDKNTGVPLNDLRRSDTIDTPAAKPEGGSGVPLDNIDRDKTDDTAGKSTVPRSAE